MRKYLLISICVIISIFASLISNNIFLTDSKNIITILLTLLGLCFTSFTFIFATLVKIKNEYNTDDMGKKIINLLNSMKEELFFIFYLSLLCIILNMFYSFDFPLIKNPTNIDFNLIIISSCKDVIFNFGFSLITCLSLYTLYDFLKATFILLKLEL